MLFTFLLVVQAIIAAVLVTLILMQRSEGGGLTGGSPTGLMSARGTADFLTRGTAILATLFVVNSIALAILASVGHRKSDIDTSLATRPVQPAPTATSAPADPLAAAASQAGGANAANGAATK